MHPQCTLSDTEAARFWSKVARTDTCWLWTGGRFKNGYGACRLRGRAIGAHRVAWETEHGPVPPKMDVSPRCGVRNCVRPTGDDHLRLMTRSALTAAANAGARIARETARAEERAAKLAKMTAPCRVCGAARSAGNGPKGMCNRCYERARVAAKGDQAGKSRAYYLANRERVKAKATTYYAANRMRVMAHVLGKYHSLTPEQKLEQSRKRRYAHPDRARERNHLRRVKTRGALVVAKVSMDDIYARDRGLCQICLKPVSRKEASPDHILPIKYGGTHEPRNVRLTHVRCNIKRKHLGAAQLRLLG